MKEWSEVQSQSKMMNMKINSRGASFVAKEEFFAVAEDTKKRQVGISFFALISCCSSLTRTRAEHADAHGSDQLHIHSSSRFSFALMFSLFLHYGGFTLLSAVASQRCCFAFYSHNDPARKERRSLIFLIRDGHKRSHVCGDMSWYNFCKTVL